MVNNIATPGAPSTNSIKFNSTMDNWLHAPWSVGRNHLSIPVISSQTSLGMQSFIHAEIKDISCL